MNNTTTSAPRPRPAWLQPRYLLRAGLYGAGAVGPTAMGFVLLPVYARTLSLAGFGSLTLITAAYSLFSAVTLLGLNSALVREYYDYRDESDRRRMIGAITALVGLVSLGAAALLMATMWLVPGLSDFVLGSRSGEIVALALAYFVAQNIFALQQAAARASGNAARFASLAAVQSGLLALLAVLLLVVHHLGIRGFVLASLGAALGGTTVGLLVRRDRPRLPADWQRFLRPALAYGLPLVAVNVSGWGLGLVDRYLVNSILGLESTGLYGVAARLGGVTNLLIVVPLGALLPPMVFQRQARSGIGAAARLVSRFHRGTLVLVLLAATALTLAADPLIRLVTGPQYAAAAPALRWIAWGAAANASVQVLANLHALLRRTGVIATLTVGAAVVKITATLFLLPRMGLEGAGLASFISFTLLALGVAGTGWYLVRHAAPAGGAES